MNIGMGQCSCGEHWCNRIQLCPDAKRYPPP